MISCLFIFRICWGTNFALDPGQGIRRMIPKIRLSCVHVSTRSVSAVLLAACLLFAPFAEGTASTKGKLKGKGGKAKEPEEDSDSIVKDTDTYNAANKGQASSTVPVMSKTTKGKNQGTDKAAPVAMAPKSGTVANNTPVPAPVTNNNLTETPQKKDATASQKAEQPTPTQPQNDVVATPAQVLPNKMWSAKDLAQRTAHQNSRMFKYFLGNSIFEKTGKLLTRLAVVESLNQLIYSGLKENKELMENDSLHLKLDDINICKLQSSDLEVIALYNRSTPSVGIKRFIEKISDIITSKCYNVQEPLEISIDDITNASNDSVTKRSVSRFNSYFGVSGLEGEVEPIKVSFKIVKLNYQEDFGHIKITLEIKSNYCDSFSLNMDICAVEVSFEVVHLHVYPKINRFSCSPNAQPADPPTF